MEKTLIQVWSSDGGAGELLGEGVIHLHAYRKHHTLVFLIANTKPERFVRDTSSLPFSLC